MRGLFLSMFITFPAPIARAREEEVLFLSLLRKRLSDAEGWTRHYEKLSEEETSHLLSLFDFDNGLVLHPDVHCYGYGYRVAHTTPKPKISDGKGRYDVLLSFDYTQLPESFTFRRMAEVFMRPKNIERIVGCGYEAPVNDEGRYSY